MPIQLLAVILSLLAAQLPAAGSSRFCLAGSACVDAASGRVAIAPAETSRSFTWAVEEPAPAIVLGTVPAGAAHVELPARTSTVELRLASDDPARWPADTQFTVRQENDEWTFVAPASQTRNPVRLRVRPGLYEVEARAVRHLPARASFTAGESAVVQAIRLQRLPLITGRAIAKATREPVAGATVTIDDTVVAVTDGTGAFAVDADPQQWPARLVVSAGGFGKAILEVPAARRDTQFLDIPLSAGGVVAVAVARPAAIDELTVCLYSRRAALQADRSPVATRKLGRDDRLARFEEVAQGDYVVHVTGAKEGERFGEVFSLAAGEERTIDVAIEPMRLSIEVERAGAPVSRATIDLTHDAGRWRTSITTNEDGRRELAIWQAGKVSIAVVGPPLVNTPHFETTSLPREEEIDWRIAVSTREIRGTVVDAVTGKPIPKAPVAHETASTMVTAQSDDHGVFRLTGVAPGMQRITSAVDGYLPAQIRVVIDEADQQREVTLRLRPVASTRLAVRDAAGRPVAGAAVLDYSGSTLMGQRLTDACLDDCDLDRDGGRQAGAASVGRRPVQRHRRSR